MLTSESSGVHYSVSSNAELQDLDLIFTKVSQRAVYPIFLNTLTAALSWGAGGAFIFMGNILVATPGIILCIKIVFLYDLQTINSY